MTCGVKSARRSDRGAKQHGFWTGRSAAPSRRHRPLPAAARATRCHPGLGGRVRIPAVGQVRARSARQGTRGLFIRVSVGFCRCKTQSNVFVVSIKAVNAVPAECFVACHRGPPTPSPRSFLVYSAPPVRAAQPQRGAVHPQAARPQAEPQLAARGLQPTAQRLEPRLRHSFRTGLRPPCLLPRAMGCS